MAEWRAECIINRDYIREENPEAAEAWETGAGIIDSIADYLGPAFAEQKKEIDAKEKTITLLRDQLKRAARQLRDIQRIASGEYHENRAKIHELNKEEGERAREQMHLMEMIMTITTRTTLDD